MIIENPYSTKHYLYRYWALEPSLIDMDRSLSGDYFKKPTQYWFINFKPQNNILWGEYTVKNKTKQIIKSNKVNRSLISAEYASRFIREYIIKEE